MPNPGKIAKEVEEVYRKGIAALRAGAKALGPEAVRQFEAKAVFVERKFRDAIADEASGRPEVAEMQKEEGADAYAELHILYNDLKGASVARRMVTATPKTPTVKSPLSPPRMTGAPLPKITLPGARPVTPEEIEDQAKRIVKVTGEISEMETAIASRRAEPMTQEEEDTLAQVAALTTGATEQLGSGRVALAERLVREAAGKFGRMVGAPIQAEITAELLMPREERRALLQAAKEWEARYLAELKAGRKEESLALKRMSTEARELIKQTYPLPRLQRWIQEYEVANPRMIALTWPARMGVGLFINWRYWAGMIVFALFIFEEVSQAFGLLLSMGIHGKKERASKPVDNPLDMTGMTDEEYEEWRLGKLLPDGTRSGGVDVSLQLYQGTSENMHWWVKYPGLYALIFREPYTGYDAFNFVNIAEMKSLLAEIDATRQAYRLGFPTPAGVKEAQDAQRAVKEAFDAVDTLRYELRNIEQRRIPGAAMDVVDTVGLSRVVEKMDELQTVASDVLAKNKRRLKPLDEQTQGSVTRGYESAEIANNTAIIEWKRALTGYIQGATQGADTGETLGESLRK